MFVKKTVAVVQVTDDEQGIAIQSPPGLPPPPMVIHPEEEQDGVVIYVTVQQ